MFLRFFLRVGSLHNNQYHRGSNPLQQTINILFYHVYPKFTYFTALPSDADHTGIFQSKRQRFQWTLQQGRCGKEFLSMVNIFSIKCDRFRQYETNRYRVLINGNGDNIFVSVLIEIESNCAASSKRKDPRLQPNVAISDESTAAIRSGILLVVKISLVA